MRMSCNGCRVLRKGCSEGCTIRPCLQWIKSPEAQANATVFLAKFYGRAGLVNLINAGPDNLRPAIFRSLMYEACGRIVNPIYGSVGLLWSGSWHLCQAAVEAVLKGRSPIAQVSTDAAASGSAAVLKCYDIRHVAKRREGGGGGSPGDLHGLAAKSRARFKRSGRSAAAVAATEAFRRAGSPHLEEESRENGSALSAETAEGSQVSQGEPEAETGEGLDLSLGLALQDRDAAGCLAVLRPVPEKMREMEADAWHVRLGLGLAP